VPINTIVAQRVNTHTPGYETLQHIYMCYTLIYIYNIQILRIATKRIVKNNITKMLLLPVEWFAREMLHRHIFVNPVPF